MKTKREINPDGSFVEVSDNHQNSIEVGQTSKGDWYVKSVKIYESDPEAHELILRRSMMKAESIVAARNKERSAE